MTSVSGEAENLGSRIFRRIARRPSERGLAPEMPGGLPWLGHAAFFHAPTDVLSARECYQFTVPVFGQGVAYDVPTDVMDQQLAWLHPALSDKRLRTYARVMAEECDTYLDAWADHGEVDLFDVTNQLTTF